MAHRVKASAVQSAFIHTERENRRFMPPLIFVGDPLKESAIIAASDNFSDDLLRQEVHQYLKVVFEKMFFTR